MATQPAACKNAVGKPLPEVLEVLHPLEEADSHTTAIGVDVRENSDASIP